MLTDTYNERIRLGWQSPIGTPWIYPYMFPHSMFGKADNVVAAMANVSNEPWPLTFQDKSVQYNLNKLVNVIRESIMDEEEEVGMYDNLAKLAPDDEQKNIILGIAQNEAMHSQILKKIFYQITR